MSRERWVLAWALFLFLIGAASARGDVVISEFQASNRATLADGDGDFPDWIELYNPDPFPADLTGWSLTDDSRNPKKWILPEVVLGGGEFLVVFASGKDRRDPAGELHASFKLGAGGEYLALVDRAGNVTSEYRPEYPEQVEDASYGLDTELAREKVVEVGATAHYLVPTSAEIQDTWMGSDFDDAAWATGPTGIGFDRRTQPTLTDLIRTDVGDLMQNRNGSIYIRIRFDLDEQQLNRLFQLRVRYNDGFVAYVNGTEVARRNPPRSSLRYTSVAGAGRSDAETRTIEDVPFETTESLRAGVNVLAIQAMNSTRRGSEFLMVPEVEAIQVISVKTDRALYFEIPTPAWPNSDGRTAVAPPPVLSQPSGAHPEGQIVELSTQLAGAEIRFTLDGTTPSRGSEVYTAPILIDSTVVLHAKTYHPDFLPSRTVSASYVPLAANILEFNSNLPLVVCTTFGRPIGAACEGPYTPGHFMLFTPGMDGRTRLTDEAHFADLAGLRKRGSSTCNRPKFSFNVEIRDAAGEDKDVKILDFPEDSDYVMYGPYNFDRALMRNPLAYWMSREVGPWAARTRFVECFFQQRAGPVSLANYFGVYALMEKNKRHPEKIAVERLTPRDNEEPEVKGGYILRRDRVDAGEIATSAGGYNNLVFVYPKQPTAAQRLYISGYINRAVASLNPNIGRQEDSDLIDFGQFLDHHILNWYPKNVDAFRLSGYMYKTREGMLAMGPVWDYDRTMGCADDDRARNPEGWDNDPVGDGGTRYFEAGGLGSWYSRLFQSRPPTGDSPWARAYRARWRTLRAGPLATDNILSRIDLWAEELGEAAERNFEKWRQVRPRANLRNFQGEVDHLKNWLATRADWIDSQFIEPPTLSHEGGRVDRGLQVTITVPEGRIFYTVNGPDPRGPGSQPHPDAIESGGPITISENTRIRTRVLVGDRVWSALVEATFVTDVPALLVTEIMYNAPAEPGDTFRSADFDFLELQNTGTEPIEVAGFQIVQPLTLGRVRTVFDFSDSEIAVLQPGAFVVVAERREAFSARYGEGLPVAGEFGTGLSNTRMNLLLRGPLGESFLEFGYNDDWYPETDGQGPSMVIRDVNLPRDQWSVAEGWRASLESGGSPGRADEPAAEGLQLAGDINQDRRLNVADPVGMLRHLFQGTVTLPCETPGGNNTLLDVSGDQSVNIADAVHLLRFIFDRGAPPALGLGCVPISGCPDACVAPQ